MSEWINVENRLPEPFESVLLYDPYELSPVFEGYFVPDDHLFAAANILHGQLGRLQIGEEVTHWMPLPKPPEDKP